MIITRTRFSPWVGLLLMKKFFIGISFVISDSNFVIPQNVFGKSTKNILWPHCIAVQILSEIYF